MLRFFRQIRQRLLTDNKFSKYLLYAIGEILLVVIGILIALQIDNWQKNKENILQEQMLLAGIKDDLIADTLQIVNRFEHSYNDFNRNIRLFDSIREVESQSLDVKYVDSIYARCIRNRNTFFPVVGTYKSIISNGLSGMIRNQNLFKKIQGLYERYYVGMQKSGDRIDELSDEIRFVNRDLMSLSENERILFYISPSSRNDVELWRKQLSAFARNLEGGKRNIREILIHIEKELNTDN